MQFGPSNQNWTFKTCNLVLQETLISIIQNLFTVFSSLGVLYRINIRLSRNWVSTLWTRVLPVFIKVFIYILRFWMIQWFKAISNMVFKRIYLSISYKPYILIKGYFQRFLNHTFHLLTYSVRSDSPQLYFSRILGVRGYFTYIAPVSFFPGYTM